jgi:hypothetical protein
MSDQLSDLTDVVELNDMPVFTTGEYPQGTYNLNDLQALADSYDPAFHEAPNYLVHADSEGNRPGGNLAFGWIKRLYVRGQTLFADLAQVPRIFADLVLAGRIKKRSVEIYPNLDGKGPYLRALAWPMIPQVKALADLHPTQVFSETVDPSETFFSISFQEKEPIMNETETQYVTKPELEALIKELKADLLGQHRKAQAVSDVKVFCEQMVLAGKMTPAERATEEPILAGQVERELSPDFAEGQTPLSRQRMDYFRNRPSVIRPDQPETNPAKPEPDHSTLVRYFNEHQEFFTRLGVSLDDLILAEAVEKNKTNPLIA